MEGKEKELLPITADALDIVKADLSAEEIEVVLDYFEKTRFHPVHNLIMQCKQEACQYKDKCPFAKLNKYPKYGEDCYVEVILIRVWTEQLVGELEIDPENTVDQAQVREIVAMGVFENRAYMGHLSKDPQVLEVIKNIAFDGTPIVERELHPLLKYLAENSKVKSKIREELISTREARAKHNVVQVDNVLDRFNKMLEGREAKELEAPK